MWKASVMINQNVRDLPNQSEDNETQFVRDHPNQGEDNSIEFLCVVHDVDGQNGYQTGTRDGTNDGELRENEISIESVNQSYRRDNK